MKEKMEGPAEEKMEHLGGKHHKAHKGFGKKHHGLGGKMKHEGKERHK